MVQRDPLQRVAEAMREAAPDLGFVVVAIENQGGECAPGLREVVIEQALEGVSPAEVEAAAAFLLDNLRSSMAAARCGCDACQDRTARVEAALVALTPAKAPRSGMH